MNDPAIHADHLPGDEGRAIRRQEQHRTGNILRHALAREQDMPLDHGDLLRGHHLPGQRGEHEARRDRVDPDVKSAELHRRIAGQRVHGCLGRGIGRIVDVAGQRHPGRGVDD